MDKATQIWNQYQVLRDEIKSADSLNYQIIGVIVAAAAAIIVAGFGRPDPLAKSAVFLCIFTVTIPGYRLLYGNRCRTWRISTYIRVFLEPELEHIKWESRLDEQRRNAGSSHNESSFSSLVQKNEWFIVTLINSVAFLAVLGGLGQYYFTQPEIHSLAQNAYAIVVGIGTLLLYIICFSLNRNREISLVRLGTVEKNFLESWEKLKKESSEPR